jgi:hypothetical protein
VLGGEFLLVDGERAILKHLVHLGANSMGESGLEDQSEGRWHDREQDKKDAQENAEPLRATHDLSLQTAHHPGCGAPATPR